MRFRPKPSTTAPRVAYVQFDRPGSTYIIAPLAGTYLHRDGVMAWLESEAEAWDAAAETPEKFAETPELCRAVAASLRTVIAREWTEK